LAANLPQISNILRMASGVAANNATSTDYLNRHQKYLLCRNQRQHADANTAALFTIKHTIKTTITSKLQKQTNETYESPIEDRGRGIDG
jgi:hypothetical protein